MFTRSIAIADCIPSGLAREVVHAEPQRHLIQLGPSYCARIAMMKTTPLLAIACMLLAMIMAMAASAAPATDQVRIRYEPPKEQRHQAIYDDLRERRALERLREFLSPFRLPRILEIELADCDGEADAFYGDDIITICYEYVEVLWDSMPEETTPGGVAPIDAVIGPFFDTSLHEFAHALFDMLDVPVLGRVEDAADQVAAYIYLNLGPVESRRLILGTAYAFLAEADREGPRSMTDFADEHGTPAQRGYNVLCIAYGADEELFSDVARSGYLPEERAEYCWEEYEQVQDAYEMLLGPHIDQVLAEEIFERTWLLR